MKNWNRFFAAILTTALVAGCGKDNPGNNNVDPEDSKKAAYMSISVALPSAKSTRSETENGGGSTGGSRARRLLRGGADRLLQREDRADFHGNGGL